MVQTLEKNADLAKKIKVFAIPNEKNYDKVQPLKHKGSEMVEKIGNEQIHQFWANAMQQKANPAGSTDGDDADASLRVSYASFMAAATESPEDDPQAVEAAKQLIESGQLDTADNIRQVAENILDSGI